MISYGENIKDSLGCVHSIDNLVVEYFVRSYQSQTVIDSLASSVFEPISGWNKADNTKLDMPACSKFSWFKSSIWCTGIYIQYGHYSQYDMLDRERTVLPILRIKFNPNKYISSDVLARLLDWVAEWCEDGVVVKFDYAVDVPVPLKDIVVHSRKEPGLFKGTRYYGQRNKHGRLKIYDKKAESSLPDDTSRVEWTFCCGKPIVFDDVYWFTCGPDPLPDFSAMSAQTQTLARLLLDIRSLGGDVRESMRHLDSRTAKKLEPYTIGTGVQLLDSCFGFLTGLLKSYCDELSLSFHSDGVNRIDIGSASTRLSNDDLESEKSDKLPF